MEGRLVQVYTHYNSIISDGKRVRRMRRTELSAQKLQNSFRNRSRGMHITQCSQRQLSKSRSIPKLEPRKFNYQKSSVNKNHLSMVQQEYFNNVKDLQTPKFQKKYDSKLLSNSVNRGSKFKSSRQHSNLSVSKTGRNSSIKGSKQNYKQSPSAYRQQNNIQDSPNIKQKMSPKALPKTQKQMIANRSRSKNQSHSKEFVAAASNAKKSNNSSINMKNNPSKISNLSLSRNQGNELKVDDYGFGEQRSSKLSRFSKRSKHSSIRSQIKQKLQALNLHQASNNNNNNSKISISNKQVIKSKRNSQIIPNRSSVSSRHRQSQNSSHISTNSKVQQNEKQYEIQIKKQTIQPKSTEYQQFDQIFTKQISNLNAQQTNFSKLKLQQYVNPVLKGSSAKRQSWKDAIKSLTELDSSQGQPQQNQATNQNFHQSKRISLRLDSMRQDQTSFDKASDKNLLSVASKQTSQRKSLGSLSSQADAGSLKGVLDSIQIHDFIVNLISQFKDDTLKFSEQFGYEEQHETQMLCFLLQKKHFLEKSNIVKALKGQKNIFKLSTIEIQTQVLRKYLQTFQIQNLVRNYETQKIRLFQTLQKTYHELKPRHKKNPYLKLQTPNDTFSNQIVRILDLEMVQLQKKLQSTNDQDEQQYLQNRIFLIMETIFLLSELNGRPAKKIEFLEQVSDMEAYFQQNKQILQETIDYFKKIK